MRNFLYLLIALILLNSCQSSKKEVQEITNDNPNLARILDHYYKERMQLFPVESTWNGDTAYNDLLYADFTDSYKIKLKDFYDRTLDSLHTFNKDSLNENDRISYDFMEEYLDQMRKELDYHFNLIPTDQMWGFHLRMGQFASGESAQPFYTVNDYKNWLKRIDAMDAWMDSAIVYFRRGLKEGVTLPQPLVKKMIPQFRAMVTTSPAGNLYFSPVTKFPESFTATEKKELTAAFENAVMQIVVPMNRRMADFLEKEYMPGARTTSGYGAMPDGQEFYKLRVRMGTTTNKSTDEIFNLGLTEVARIRKEMEKVMKATGFKGDLNSFFTYLRTDPKFTPYKTPEEVLQAFHTIHDSIKSHVKDLFNIEPSTPFEIKRTEAFREKTASAEYNGSPDNKKPGVFYVPIPDPAKFNITSGMESLFLHEAIPGHHYQISLQRENTKLPMPRKFDNNSNAYIEGWALYAESMGKELGLFKDPYQYMGALGDEMHRAIRLVVDVGIHAKGMTREDAIAYMMNNEQASQEYAEMEIERYMSGPGQALGYKIGSIKIRELRDKYRKQLGDKFDIREFHKALLMDGSMPLTTLELKMDRWAAKQ